MSDEFAAPLDYESKLARDRRFIEKLQRHGREQAEEFLRDPSRHLVPA